MKLAKKIKTAKNYLVSIGSAIFLLLGAGGLLPYTAQAAAGDAYFSLTPSSGSYIVGNNLVLSVSETSTSGDNTNAVQANLSYPSGLLQYQSTSLDGPFTLCGQNTGGSGSVNIGCASTTAASGSAAIAQITFSVLASGTAPITMTSGSDIDSTSGSSVWNGVLPTASFTLSKAATTPTTPVSTPPSTTTKSSSPPTTTTKSTTTTTAPTATQSAVTPLAATTPAPSLASISVTVVNSQNKAIKGAKVTLDKHSYLLTNSYGIANFSAVVSGKYTISTTDAGRKSVSTSVVITPGENKLLRLQLLDVAKKNDWAVLAIIGVIIIIGLVGGGIYLRAYRRKLKTAPTTSPTSVTPTTADSSENLTPLPLTNTVSPEQLPDPKIVSPVASPTTTPIAPETLPPTPEPPAPAVPTSQTETIIHPTEPQNPQST